MSEAIRLTRLLMPLALMGATIPFAGCAPAYHCYSECHVNCRYCPPSPMPYTTYDARACHSWQAAKYLNGQPSAGKAEARNEQPGEEGNQEASTAQPEPSPR